MAKGRGVACAYGTDTYPGRSSHESSRAVQHPVRDEDRGRSSDLWAFGFLGRFLPHAASRTGDLRRQFSAVSVFRSHLPLRGSSGFSPDSLLGPALVPDTAMGHKILCLGDCVNYVYAATQLGCKGTSNLKNFLYNPRALPIRFARTRASAWKIRLAQSILLKAPVAQPDRAPAF